MSHKADRSFFASKRPWSRRKDLILGYYLKPYLPKIATQGRPILVVDGFAGPGKFGDGEPGSPLIIAKLLSEMRSTRAVAHRLLCIESDPSLAAELQANLSQYSSFAEVRPRKFVDALNEIEPLAASHSTFLYVDPFTVEGLDWRVMDRVFQLVNKGKSVELLLNFNTPSFVRRGLAALKLAVPPIDRSNEDESPLDIDAEGPADVLALDRVVGGAWWRDIVGATSGFDETVSTIADQVTAKFRTRFKEVCVHAVKALPHHTVPKYHIIHASRSQESLPLINDAMAKSREALAELAKPSEDTLFETRAFELIPDRARLTSLLSQGLTARMSRGSLIAKVIRCAVGDYTETEIRRAITALIKQKRIASHTGRARIPDSEEIWKVGGW